MAEAAIADGFLPDTISSDLHSRHLAQQAEHDLPLVFSKLIACGMLETDALKAATSTSAGILRLDDQIGQLAPGHCADLTLLRPASEPTLLVDAYGNQREGTRWHASFTMRGGQIQHGLRR